MLNCHHLVLSVIANVYRRYITVEHVLQLLGMCRLSRIWNSLRVELIYSATQEDFDEQSISSTKGTPEMKLDWACVAELRA